MSVPTPLDGSFAEGMEVEGRDDERLSVELPEGSMEGWLVPCGALVLSVPKLLDGSFTEGTEVEGRDDEILSVELPEGNMEGWLVF